MQISSSTAISFIGGGNMAQALIGGLLAQSVRPQQITVAEPVLSLHDTLKQLGVQVTCDNRQAILQADVVILAVKPQSMAEVLIALQGVLNRQLVISIAAGVTVAAITQLLGGDCQIVRAMPNTPALIQAGATGLYAPAGVGSAARELATQLMQAAGLVLWVKEEAQLDAVTALSGSGPAYFFYMMEAMIAAGTGLGLPAEQATALTLQTALGAAKMAHASALLPGQLRQHVTSPNGTTQAAIEVLNARQVDKHVAAAVQAAAARSAELAALFENLTS